MIHKHDDMMKRYEPTVPRNDGISTVLHEQSDSVHVTRFTGTTKRCAAAFILRVNICILLDEKRDNPFLYGITG